MVFAVWAGKSKFLTSEAGAVFKGSYEWGRDHLDDMVARAGAERGFAPALVRDYFTKFIKYPLGPKHLEGLSRFRKLVMELDRTSVAV